MYRISLFKLISFDHIYAFLILSLSHDTSRFGSRSLFKTLRAWHSWSIWDKAKLLFKLFWW